MNEIEIRRYAELMKDLDLTGLEITEDNKVVRLERTPASAPAAGYPVVSLPVPGNTANPENTKAPAEAGDPACFSVKSPMVGVFYAAPAENAEPFASPGDRIEKGKTLCIIEAMKLMNEICAEEGGTLEEVCVTDGQVVEYGTELFRIRR